MKILYIAFACNPYVGSEAFCGWSWPLAMRKYCDVYVITRKENKTGIEKYINEHKITDIKFFYYDIPDILNIYYKSGKMYMPYSVVWQSTSFHFIKKLHEKYQFDYIHQVTLGDFRLINPAWKLNSKFIFGPVGGAQLTPKSLKKYIGTDNKSEKRREWINRSLRSYPSYRKALNQMHLIFAANPETQQYLQNCIERPDRCRLLTENGVNSEQIHALLEKESHNKAVLLWAGRMIKRKGLNFLLDVLPLVKTEKPYKLMLVGEGPEKSNLEEQANALGIGENVEFVGRVSYEEMQKLYLSSDIFVFPSLRETTGTVLFEAMVNGLPVVTFNQNGAALLINEDCGFKIDIHQSIEKIKIDYADALKKLIDEPKECRRMGKNAYFRIINNYTWTKKCEAFFENYMR